MTDVRSALATLATITTCAAPQPPIRRSIPGEHPATLLISAAHVAAENAPFTALSAAISAFFGDELGHALTGREGDTAAAFVAEIIARHVAAARARLAAPTPALDWSDRDSLAAVSSAAIRRAGDLRFLEILAAPVSA